MESSEQPTAPYLDAVVAYAFRGTARYHVPGHKGGPGADPGLRKAIGLDGLAADVPQDIHGIDLGPSPTPYERAEQLAAEAFGAARTFFLTNGATQGNHTLCLALAPLGTRIVAQRNSHASIVDGLVLSGGAPELRRAGVRRRSSGSRTASPRPRWRRRCATRPDAQGRVRRLADLLRHGGRRRRAAPRSRTARACRSSSTRPGARTSASTTRCRPPRCRRARTRCSRARTRSPAR